MVNAGEIKVPGIVAAEERILDGNTIAYLPSETLGEAGAGDGSLAILDEIIPLIVRDDEFRDNLPLIFDIDDKLWKKVFFVLIHTAKPIIVSDGFDIGDTQNFVAIGEGQRLHDGNAVDNDKAIGAGYVRATAKSVLDDSEEGKQE